VGNGKGGIGDLAHSCQALDVERVVREKGSELESLSNQGWLFWHELKL